MNANTADEDSGERAPGHAPGAITVVIPTHNRAVLLAEAIESVLHSMLAIPPQQVIVVDDASTDATPEVAASYGVRYVRVDLGPPGAVRNAGLAQCDTEYVTFLDDDDVWLPGNMVAQLEALEAHPAVGVAFAQHLARRDGAVQQRPLPPLRSFGPKTADQVAIDQPQIGTVLFRRAVLAGIGGFDERANFYEDKDVCIRATVAGGAYACASLGLLYTERLPNSDFAARNWEAMGDYGRLWRSWRRSGAISRRTMLRLHRAVAGRLSFMFIMQARQEAAAGNRSAARQWLGRALRVSPPHVAAHSSLYLRALAVTFLGVWV